MYEGVVAPRPQIGRQQPRLSSRTPARVWGRARATIYKTKLTIGGRALGTGPASAAEMAVQFYVGDQCSLGGERRGGRGHRAAGDRGRSGLGDGGRARLERRSSRTGPRPPEAGLPRA